VLSAIVVHLRLDAERRSAVVWLAARGDRALARHFVEVSAGEAPVVEKVVEADADKVAPVVSVCVRNLNSVL
jgi:hypothetical protein